MADPTQITPGKSRQLVAVATDAQGGTRELSTGVTWSSSNAVVATVSAAGLLQAQAPGIVVVEAKASGLVDSLALEVGAPPAPLARAAVVIDNALKCAVAGQTPVVFDAAASEGYQLKYSWDYGDDRADTTPDARVTRTLARIQTRAAKLTITDAFGRSVSPPDIPYCSIDLRSGATIYGGYYHTHGNVVTEHVLYVTYQGMNEIAGTYRRYDKDGTRTQHEFSGTIAADLGVTLRIDNGVRMNGRVRQFTPSGAQRELEFNVENGDDGGDRIVLSYHPSS